MIAAVKKDLSELQRSPPGKRFQATYQVARRNGVKTSTGARLLRLGVAVVALVLGVIFAFIPGPGVVFFALAGAMLAPESRRLAIMLDWTEVKIRAGLKWAKRSWDKLGWFARSVVVLIGALVGGAAGWVMWQRLFG